MPDGKADTAGSGRVRLEGRGYQDRRGRRRWGGGQGRCQTRRLGVGQQARPTHGQQHVSKQTLCRRADGLEWHEETLAPFHPPSETV